MTLSKLSETEAGILKLRYTEASVFEHLCTEASVFELLCTATGVFELLCAEATVLELLHAEASLNELLGSLSFCFSSCHEVHERCHHVMRMSPSHHQCNPKWWFAGPVRLGPLCQNFLWPCSPVQDPF